MKIITLLNTLPQHLLKFSWHCCITYEERTEAKRKSWSYIHNCQAEKLSLTPASTTDVLNFTLKILCLIMLLFPCPF